MTNFLLIIIIVLLIGGAPLLFFLMAGAGFAVIGLIGLAIAVTLYLAVMSAIWSWAGWAGVVAITVGLVAASWYFRKQDKKEQELQRIEELARLYARGAEFITRASLIGLIEREMDHKPSEDRRKRLMAAQERMKEADDHRAMWEENDNRHGGRP